VVDNSVVNNTPVVATPPVVGEPKSKKWIFISIGAVVVIGIVIAVFLMIGGGEEELTDAEYAELLAEKSDEITGSIEECTLGGAYSIEFPDSCGNLCEAQRNEITCEPIPQYACGCGDNKCWNGTACEDI